MTRALRRDLITRKLTNFRTLESRMGAAQALKKRELTERYRTLNAFLDSATVHVIDTPNDPHFREFYNLYKTVFTLPSERETPRGFNEVLAINNNTELAALVGGKYREATILMRDPTTNEVIGAINFTAYPMNDDVARETGIDATSHVIYLFTHQDYRKAGVAKRLKDLTKKYVKAFTLGENPKSAILDNKQLSRDINLLSMCEQNAPELMTAREYLDDNVNAGIDQVDRLRHWVRAGYNRMNMEYVQPPLEEGGDPCEYLTLNAEAPVNTRIPGSVIAAHLDRFFGISVLKGKKPQDEPTYQKSRRQLMTAQADVGLFQDTTYFDRVGQDITGLLDDATIGRKRVASDKTIGEILNYHVQTS